MFQIKFYETPDGFSPIHDLLESLRKRSTTDKDARIQYNQISRYIYLLSEHGTNLPIEFIKHLSGDIWELRPGNNRIFFFYFDKETYVLLHYYRKKSDKTPRKEITKAKAEVKDFRSRKGNKQ